MKTGKVLGGSLGAIAMLILAQLLAQVLVMGLSLVHVPAAICNAVAGGLYIGFAYFLLRLFAKKALKMELCDLGIPAFHIKWKWVSVAVLLPIVVTGIYLLLPGEFVNSNMEKGQAIAGLCTGIFFTGLGAGFVEEMVFRGFIMNLLDKRWNRTVAIVVPSVLFGVVHIIGMEFSPVSCLLVLVAGSFVGIMFSLIALDENSVWNSGIVHALWNIVILGGGLYISETVDEYSMITYVLESKSFLVTGGEFGIESSVVAVAAYVIVSVIAALSMRNRAKL